MDAEMPSAHDIAALWALRDDRFRAVQCGSTTTFSDGNREVSGGRQSAYQKELAR